MVHDGSVYCPDFHQMLLHDDDDDGDDADPLNGEVRLFKGKDRWVDLIHTALSSHSLRFG